MSPITQFFLPQYYLSTEKAQRTAHLFIKFSLISILFAVGYVIDSFFTGFVVARYMMMISIIFFTTQLFSYKKGLLSLRVATHSFVFFCWVIIVVLVLFSGGLQSFVLSWITLIPILGLILLSKRAAWIWGAIGFVTVVTLFFLATKLFIPASLIVANNDVLTASLQIGLQFIVLTLTYVFDQQQNKLINKIEEQNRRLTNSQEEIEQQNKELTQSKEELSTQRDLVDLQNVALTEAAKTIELKNSELTAKNDFLEIEIGKRTNELVEYNQQLEQFAFVSSHNLRAPIARILGLGNLLEITSNPNDEIQIKKNLIHSTKELDRVVRDLNTILEIRKSTNQPTVALDLSTELNLVKISLEKEINDSHATIDEDFTAAPNIKTVRPYLDSILMNLLSNALKYRHADRYPKIMVRSEWKDECVCLIMSDNGIGMNLELVSKKIFTMYSRFHSHVEGKGLGLYLVKTQAETLGGKIEVKSTVNEGTTFFVYLKSSL